MAFIPTYTIVQAQDGLSLLFTETTGNGSTGYDGTPAYTQVVDTQFKFTTPSDEIKNVVNTYLPTQNTAPNGTTTFLPADFGMTRFENGVYQLELKYIVKEVSGQIEPGVTYTVTGTGFFVYNTEAYNPGDIFVGISGITTYTASPSIYPTYSVTVTSNFLLYHDVKQCLKSLMLLRCKNNCDCKDDYNFAVSELVIDMNTALLAFQNNSFKCANETLTRISNMCSSFCTDCNC
jgi:hypothetical protein